MMIACFQENRPNFAAVLATVYGESPLVSMVWTQEFSSLQIRLVQTLYVGGFPKKSQQPSLLVQQIDPPLRKRPVYEGDDLGRHTSNDILGPGGLTKTLHTVDGHAKCDKPPKGWLKHVETL